MKSFSVIQHFYLLKICLWQKNDLTHGNKRLFGRLEIIGTTNFFVYGIKKSTQRDSAA
jgi:hypothetical protein